MSTPSRLKARPAPPARNPSLARLQTPLIPLRRCTRCHAVKPLTRFYTKSLKYQTPTNKHCSQCKQCMRTQNLARYHERKAEALQINQLRWQPGESIISYLTRRHQARKTNGNGHANP